ncbi:ribonuclease H-like domain-containing protein, partial [Schizophyllum commune]
LAVYTDGSSPDPAGYEKRAGGGAWFGPGDARNCNVRIQGTNQTGEAAGALLAVQKVRRDMVLNIISDSEFIVKGLTERLLSFENRGWIGVADGDYMKALIGQIRLRRAPTFIQKVKGHSGDLGNDGADRKAAAGAARENPQSMDLTVADSLSLHGAQLMSLTQALAVKGVREHKSRKKSKDGCPSVRKNLKVIRWAIMDSRGKLPCDRLIWKSFRHPDLVPSFRSFLWRANQNGYWVGSRWLVSKDLKDRANCGRCYQNCGVLKTWDHILLRCEAEGHSEIWDEADKILRECGYDSPPVPNLGAVMGCALEAPVQLKLEEKGQARLLLIVTSRAAQLAWNIRCERVIGGRTHSPPEVRNRLRKAVEAQRTLDVLLCAIKKYGNNVPKRKALLTQPAKVDAGLSTCVRRS